MQFGFDISSYQGSENFDRMRVAYNASFVIAKATEGLSLVDPRFAENWAGIKAAGLIRGAYHFARTAQDAVACAEKFVSVVRPSLPTDLLVLDLESSPMSNAATNEWAVDWCRRVKALCPGYAVGIYTPYIRNTTSVGWNKVFDYFWYARYPTQYNNKATWPSSFNPVLPDVNHFGPPKFWQFSQSFPVDGDPHDANVFNGTLSELATLNHNSNPNGKVTTMDPVFFVPEDRSVYSGYLALDHTGVYRVGNLTHWKYLASKGASLITVPVDEFRALYGLVKGDAPATTLTDAQIAAIADAVAAKVGSLPAADLKAVIRDVVLHGIGA